MEKFEGHGEALFPQEYKSRYLEEIKESEEELDGIEKLLVQAKEKMRSGVNPQGLLELIQTLEEAKSVTEKVIKGLKNLERRGKAILILDDVSDDQDSKMIH